MMAENDEIRPFTDDDLNSLIAGTTGTMPEPGALRPHPATGWMTVEKIEGSLILPPMEDMKPMKIQVPGGTLEIEPPDASERVGIIGARVVEIGKFPNDQPMVFDWGPGDMIYMASDRGIPVGDFTVVMIDKVICFTKAEEHED